MTNDIQFLKELQHELKTQDNDCQAAPRFWVIMDYEYQITMKGYHDIVSVYDHSAAESYEVKEFVKLLTGDNNPYDLSDSAIDELKDIMNSSYLEEEDLISWFDEYYKDGSIFYEKEEAVIKKNTMFLTKQEAKDHLRANSHHYSNKAHTYAMTAWRSPKVARLLNILEDFNWNSLKELELDE